MLHYLMNVAAEKPITPIGKFLLFFGTIFLIALVLTTRKPK